jgi:hypothetical protein
MTNHHPLSYFLIAITLSGCTVPTGPRVSLSQKNLSQVKRLGVHSKGDPRFSVHLERDKMTNTGTAFGGLVGLAVESGVRSSIDRNLQEQIAPFATDFDAVRETRNRLVSLLTEARLFSEVQPLTAAEEGAKPPGHLDAVLEVEITQWGLVPCSTTNPENKLQTGAQVRMRILTAGGEVIWDRSDLFLDGDCHTVEEFKSRLLEKALSRQFDAICSRIVNEIRFPQ